MITPDQQAALTAITVLNHDLFNNFFETAAVMAFCQVESHFHPHAYRYEPRIKEGSFGMMQVLESTARGLGLHGSPEQMYDIGTGIKFGMLALKQNWDVLKAHFKQSPSLSVWAASYNEGAGSAMRGNLDAAYTRVWMPAYAYWQGAIK